MRKKDVEMLFVATFTLWLTSFGDQIVDKIGSIHSRRTHAFMKTLFYLINFVINCFDLGFKFYSW
jgi:hypothetical protein